MGQRTQLAINVKFIDTKGKEHIEREVYHYQWGGYSNYMFESLIPLFINVRNYIFGVFRDPEYCIESYETILKGNLKGKRNSRSYSLSGLVLSNRYIANK